MVAIFPGGSDGKESTRMQETQLQSLGWEDPLEKEMAIHSGTIAWKIPGQRSLVGYSPWGRKGSNTTEFTSLHLGGSPVHGAEHLPHWRTRLFQVWLWSVDRQRQCHLGAH